MKTKTRHKPIYARKCNAALQRCLVFMIVALLSFSTPAQSADSAVKIRSGEHSDYSRLVFDWDKMVGYHILPQKGSVDIVFDTPATLDLSRFNAKRHAQIKNIETISTDGALHLRVLVPDNTNIKDFRIARKVVLDVYGPKKVAQKKKPKTKTTPTATATKSVEPQPKPTALAKPQTKKEAEPTPEPPQTNKVKITQTQPETAEPQKSPQAQASENTEATTKNADQNNADVQAETKIETEIDAPPPAPKNRADTVISISTLERANLAVYTRAGYLWIVLDNEYASIPPEKFGPLAVYLGEPKQFTAENGTVWRLKDPQVVNIRTHKDNLTWHIILSDKAPKVITNARVRTKNQNSEPALVVNMRSGALKTTVFTDPIIGDTLVVVPVDREEQRLKTARRTPDLELISAYLGLVVKPMRDDIQIDITGNEIEISATDGLTLTPGASRMPGLLDAGEEKETSINFEEENASISRLFDLPSWQQGGFAELNDNRRDIEQELMTAGDDNQRAAIMMRLGMLYFANNLAREALGYFRMAAVENPDIAKSPGFSALRGAARALAGHYSEAIADLSIPQLKDQPEAQLWRGFAAAKTEQWQLAAESFPKSNKLLTEYPPDIAIPFTLFMAESALRIGDTAQARSLLNTLGNYGNEMPARFSAAVAYLRGEAFRQEGEFDTAIRLWNRVIRSRDRLYYTKANLALNLLLLSQNNTTTQEALDKLDNLRFAWRGDGLETHILHTIGRLKIKNSEYQEGLVTMRRAVELAKGNREDTAPIMQDMSAAFDTLYVEGKADDISALEAIAIFDEFRELLPPGVEGRQATRNFAEYLVQLDLVDRAAKLFEELLENQQRGKEAARLGTRLASIYLLGDEAEKALETLDRTTYESLPNDILQEHDLLRARALSETGQHEQAIQTLIPYNSKESVLLEADILWRSKDWAGVAERLSPILPETQDDQKLSNEDAELVLNTAVAIKLSNNDPGLRQLKQQYMSALIGTPSETSFRIVTRTGGVSTLQDRKTMLKIAEEVDVFKGFLDSYRTNSDSDS